MKLPQIVRVKNPRGLVLPVNRYMMEYIYNDIRRGMDEISEDEQGVLHYRYMSNDFSTYAYPIFGDGTDDWAGRSGVDVKLRINEKKDGERMVCELGVVLKYTDEETGYPLSSMLVWRFDKAIVENVDGDKFHPIIKLYDGDRMVAQFVSVVNGYARFRHRAGTFTFDGANKRSKKRSADGGCFMCDKSVYVKENGIIYLKCTKYEGQVPEMEYDGEDYPSYCKRRK